MALNASCWIVRGLGIRGLLTMMGGKSFPSIIDAAAMRYGTVVPFKLSDIGEGIREVTIKEWFVSPGDKVAQFDAICEVQSDKASVTITSRYDGHVKALHHKIDEVALVGDPLIDIELDEDDDEFADISDDRIRAEAGENLAATAPPNVHLSDLVQDEEKKILTTPAVRRIAWEHKIDLAKVDASGKNGRLLKEDLLRYLEKKSGATTMREIPTRVATETSFELVPLQGYAKIMWKSMTKSLAIPHFSYCDECNVKKLVKCRKELKNYADGLGISLSLTPFFVKAASKALDEFPRLNAWVDEDSQSLKVFKEHNISLAMDTPGGLVVPNIKNVQNLSVLEIAKELNRLSELGKKCSIPLQDLAGGTFSLSNIGVIGGTYTKPVILPPQIVIGGIGKIEKLPRYDSNEKLVATEIFSVSWSADHRVVDGVTMARFSNRWKYFLENPSHLLL